MKIFLALVLFLLSTLSFAQTIKSINYDGMVHLSKPVALRMLDFEVGDNIDDKSIDTAIKNYFNQGYFNDIWVEIEDENLTFYFKEKPIISKVALKGWKENDEDVQENIIQIKKGTLYSERKLESAKKRIIEAISQDGKIDSVVEIQKEYLENGSMKVTFLVNEGEEIVIDKVNFNGIKGLNSDDFDDVIANKEHQWMGWLWGRNDGKMSLRDLEYDNLRMRDLYMQNGYLDAIVKAPFVRVNFNHYLADISYQIEEGDVYTINSISIEQDENVIDNKILKEKMKLAVGDIFNIKTFREDADKIKTAIADLSYAFVQVVPDLKKDKEKNSVDIIFRVHAGDKVKIRDVIISGNTRTLDRIIRREMFLGPNDMYSLTDLRDSRHALGRLGFFDGNTIEERRIDNKTIDLVVKVKEAATGNIQLGGGYGSYGGLLLSVSVDDRNIFGSGINVGVKAEKSEMTKNASFNISNPRLNDSDFSGNFSIFKSLSSYNDYDVDSEGVTVGVGHRFSRFISGYLGYSYSNNSYTFNDNLDSNQIDTFYFEDYAKSSVTLSGKFDNTDDYYLPREGFTFTQSFEKAGVGADANFLKSRTTFSKFYGLKDYLNFDAIFRYKSRLNIIVNNGYIPIAEKFYMGGIGSVRGYESYSLSPTLIDDDGIKRRIGGKKTFSNNIELSFPLVKKAKMRLVTYLDWGFIGDEKIDKIFENIDELSRGGYGAGVEWFSPVGPIQFMFSNPLHQKAGDKISHFDFMMGRRF